MMKNLIVFIVVLSLLASTFIDAVDVKINNQKNTQHKIKFDDLINEHITTGLQGGQYGGWSCLGCTIGLSLVEQMSVLHEKSIEETLDEICSYFPGQVGSLCTYMVNTYGNQIIALFAENKNADDVCLSLQVCTGSQCRLYNSTSTYTGPFSGKPNPILSGSKRVNDNPWAWLKKIYALWDNDHLPLEDLDSDKFSIVPTFRGYNWRGMDCNDFSNEIYPGVVSNNAEPQIDWNCNGISGSNASGTYEEMLCANSGQLGVIVAGDSAGAHFSIPPEWMTAALINKTTYTDILSVIEDEADWPHRSAYTGWVPSTEAIPVDSVYMRMRERNLCNHRDFQNLAVNGGSSDSILKTISEVSRNQQTDQPALVFVELIGNDVCSQSHNLDHMTTPSEFVAYIEATLTYLDTVLPNGSHVVFIGLVDGRVLWDTLWNRTHPVGVPYETIYEFLSCLGVNPCWGWLNPDESIRNQTSERAALLSSLYPSIIANNTYNNFDLQYYDFPFPAINAEWIANGGQTWQLIEPIDGFHPNQQANALIGANLWNQIMNDHPDWLGQVNPNNAKIIQMFGDQGGYSF
ncbi:hypothetical protein DFA_03128 [Cavenderia fasciculata]|uniref:Saposin B-type domain-containing protein n=1 Tax=Cavenderia fasciculata TaxID=261658 RepID=F4PGP9_CACFS|nr:uncharacterized protein DFA_03128 [Cavenderia fasciculata]EGG24883.1 hypothetical protein DFA_03128 [Cavenderia fasciculata]|eukprot:XP_004362734.1 hypothetical protein DFA_03128 [Cavenderia fasciculata]